MDTDLRLLSTYMKGFRDELKGNTSMEFISEQQSKAYRLGRAHAVIGDDVRSIDYLTNEEILNMIKNGVT